MEMISLQGKTNFFEKRVGEYQKAGVKKSAEEKDTKNFDFNQDMDEVDFWFDCLFISYCQIWWKAEAL